MTDEEKQDWADFIVWLSSKDAYEKCFDADTAHSCIAADTELTHLRTENAALTEANHGHDIAAHCHESGHFASSVKHVCEMCDTRLRETEKKVPFDPFTWMERWLEAYDKNNETCHAGAIMSWVYKQPMGAG